MKRSLVFGSWILLLFSCLLFSPLFTAVLLPPPNPKLIEPQPPRLTIVFWHSFAGSLGDEVNQLVSGFNNSQSLYTVKALYKGEYTDTLTSFVAAFRAKFPPDVVQVFEVGTASLLYPKGIIKPLAALQKETGIDLEVAQFLPAILAFYSEGDALQAMPFNTSVPLMFYNADLLDQVGIKTREDFPKTWQGLEKLLLALQAKGVACAYTSAYPAWIHLESFAALHGLSLFDPDNNTAIYNTKAFIAHLERLKNWQTLQLFEYGGRGNDATALFTSGRCAIFSQSSGAYKGLAALVPFSLGLAPIPLDQMITTTRHNNVIGGAALWASAGLSAEKYRGIAAFYRYISQEQVQQHWYQATGYIPLTVSDRSRLPTLEIAQYDLNREKDKRLAFPAIPLNQIRDMNDEALEAIFSQMASAEEAMCRAVDRANFTLKRFYKNNNFS